MASSSCAATPIVWKRVISELTRGRDIAEQLCLMLRGAGVDCDAASARDLVGKIIDNYTQSLSMLSAAGGESGEASQVPAVVNSGGLRWEDSGDSCKTPAPKDRRGCYKRKKTSDSWVKESTTSFDDGHAWRKYGQKAILHAKFPRSYFRCTHKFDQGCQASKQVQQIQDDPPRFKTTYHGRHTCTSLPHPIVEDEAAPDSSIILSFHSGGYKLRNALVFDASDNHLGGFSSGSDHGDVISSDVYSCTTSTHSMDIGMMGTVDLDDLLDFESLS